MPQKKYSQWQGMLALIKASLKSTAKSPSSIAFTIAFPLVFIFGFNFIGQKDAAPVPVVLDHAISKAWEEALQASPLIDVQVIDDKHDLEEAMIKGIVLAHVKEKDDQDGKRFVIASSPQAKGEIEQLEMVLENIYFKNKHVDYEALKIEKEALQLTSYSQVDFILPGQLGFSLLAASIFGTAFVFYSLRSDLVLKRFFASPIKRQNILLSEAISRMFFQLMGALFIILIGYYFLGFHLKNGIWTLIQMMVLSAISLIVFMSFGFIISGVAKSSALIPPLSNILVLPQFILADTFIPIEMFPKWLEVISRVLPLTNVNIAFRKIAFEGIPIWSLGLEMSIVLAWGVVGYVAATKLFKWE